MLKDALNLQIPENNNNPKTNNNNNNTTTTTLSNSTASSLFDEDYISQFKPEVIRNNPKKAFAALQAKVVEAEKETRQVKNSNQPFWKLYQEKREELRQNVDIEARVHLQSVMEKRKELTKINEQIVALERELRQLEEKESGTSRRGKGKGEEEEEILVNKEQLQQQQQPTK